MYTWVKYLLWAFALSTYKSLPFAYYVRIYWVFGSNLILAKYFPYWKFTAKDIFRVDRFQTYNSPLECDFYLHKNNACYFEELDIARSQLMTRNFQHFLHNYPTKSGGYVFVPVANIFGSFKKEIKPFARYHIDSRILAWDDKWIFILSKFVLNGSEAVASTCVTKYVLKDGRKTVQPIEAIKFQGLYNDDAAKQNEENLKLCSWLVNTDQLDSFEMGISNL